MRLPSHLQSPACSLPPHTLKACELPAPEETLPSVGYLPLDSGLVFRMRRPRRVHYAAVVPRQFPVRPVDARVVAVRPEDTRAQGLGHQPAGCAPEEAQRLHVPLQPGCGVLGEHRIEELMPAVREGHQEAVHPLLPPRVGIVPPPHIEEVHLRVLAGGRIIEPHGRGRQRPHPLGPLLGYVPVERRPARPEPVLVS